MSLARQPKVQATKSRPLKQQSPYSGRAIHTLVLGCDPSEIQATRALMAAQALAALWAYYGWDHVAILATDDVDSQALEHGYPGT